MQKTFVSSVFNKTYAVSESVTGNAIRQCVPDEIKKEHFEFIESSAVIMMCQNRQEEKDRERAKHDYMINLKTELEIRLLHEKVNHLIV